MGKVTETSVLFTFKFQVNAWQPQESLFLL